ncbi:DUF423 domain-containing protein [Limobrevibacterium gyesilva]|uniref:DUF423 domain-containing protein n=1 Tax=Limobrevibacterium gyesilva TaxID=2991712 RepID=A0AA41YQ83_9PROT|nr:DUF423 domain-containing protein [Limobrevibacterium gyesilva]MCW3473532.1 DUF423 domain-containing protein [Limobrevibacterium gyesilva]
MDRIWIGFGAVAGLTAVAMAAAAAHGLPDRLDPAALQMLRNAVQMQGWHALALLFTGMWAPRGGRLVNLAGAAFTLGLLLFCGAVYSLVLAGLHLASVAPIGGMLLMLGWALLGLSALRRTQ